MKKKIVILAGALLLAAASFAVVSSQTNNSVNSLLVQNVEALAQNEGDINFDCPTGCYWTSGPGCLCYDWYPGIMPGPWN